MKGHTTALEVLAYSRSLPELKLLAFVHLQRNERVNRADDFRKLNDRETFDVIIPAPGDVINLSSD